MKLLIFTLILSCASELAIAPRDLNQLYIGGGYEQYMLPELPDWAQMSSAAHCRLETKVRYLNFENLFKSYGINYEKMIHFQDSFNTAMRDYKKSKDTSEVFLKDESFIFFNVKEKVIGGAVEFQVPEFNKVSVFWLDPYMKSPKTKRIFKRLVVSARGYPIVMSRCYSREQLEQLSEQLGLGNRGIRYISASMFSPYNRFLKISDSFSLDLSQLFAQKEVTLVAPFRTKLVRGDYIFEKREIE